MKKYFSLKFLIATFILTIVSPAYSHVDRIFKITQSGTLDGIPEEYAPVSINIDKKAISTSVTLRFGKNTVTLPPCLTSLFKEPALSNLRAFGSWYHDLSDLPPYVNFELITRESGYVWREGHALLFNMASGELIQLINYEVNSNENGMYYNMLDIKKVCSKEEIQFMKPVHAQ